MLSTEFIESNYRSPLVSADDEPAPETKRSGQQVVAKAMAQADDEITVVIPGEYLARLRESSRPPPRSRPPVPQVEIVELDPAEVLVVEESASMSAPANDPTPARAFVTDDVDIAFDEVFGTA